MKIKASVTMSQRLPKATDRIREAIKGMSDIELFRTLTLCNGGNRLDRTFVSNLSGWSLEYIKTLEAQTA
jgi:hypothetical protein